MAHSTCCFIGPFSVVVSLTATPVSVCIDLLNH